jgi:hypothetical protein
MDIRKYEQLINLVINEDEAQARELFHEIVVEKSREIFESIMAEEMDDEELDEGMVGEVGDLMDEISSEEEGLDEDEFGDEFGDEEGDIELGGDDEEFDIDSEDEEEETLIRIEDKLDQLMAEFEEIMGGEEGDEDLGDEFGDEEGDADFDMGDEEGDADFDMGDEDSEDVMENVQLQKVSVTHGDNGAYTKSPGLQGSGQAGMDSHPVNFSGASESVPTAPKGPSNFYSKGETQVKGAGNFKNSPGKGNFKEKGEAAPKPKHGDDGSNARSPVAESRRSAKRRIR